MPCVRAAPTTESAIFDFPWEKDGLTWEEHNALQFLHTIEQEHPEVAHAILIRFPWLADGIIRGERFVTNGVMHLARRDPSLALLYMDLPWLADGISDDDYDMYGKVLSLTWLFAEDDLSLATRLVSFPWIADGINDREHDALDSVEKLILGSLSQQTMGEPRDTTIARRLFDFPWFVDGIEGYEGAPILFLSVFRDFLGGLQEEDLNAILDSSLFEAPFTHAKANSLGAVGFLLKDGRWEQVISQPWYQDGVTDADFVRITLITVQSEEDFQRMLQGDYLASETYSLPLAGEVTAYVISKDPYEQEALFGALGTGMKAIEDIVGAPWPDPYPVVRVISESYAPSGYSLLTGDIELHLSDMTTGTVYHELAHHYFHLFPAWMNEGAADFLETYSLHLAGDASLQSTYDSVAGGCSPMFTSGSRLEPGEKTIDNYATTSLDSVFGWECTCPWGTTWSLPNCGGCTGQSPHRQRGPWWWQNSYGPKTRSTRCCS